MCLFKQIKPVVPTCTSHFSLYMSISQQQKKTIQLTLKWSSNPFTTSISLLHMLCKKKTLFSSFFRTILFCIWRGKHTKMTHTTCHYQIGIQHFTEITTRKVRLLNRKNVLFFSHVLHVYGLYICAAVETKVVDRNVASKCVTSDFSLFVVWLYRRPYI